MGEPLVPKGTPQSRVLDLDKRVRRLARDLDIVERRVGENYTNDAPLAVLLERLQERMAATSKTSAELADYLLRNAPAPDLGKAGWLCLNPACRRSLAGRRKGTECCSGPCRAEVSRLRARGLLPPKGDGSRNGSLPR